MRSEHEWHEGNVLLVEICRTVRKVMLMVMTRCCFYVVFVAAVELHVSVPNIAQLDEREISKM